MVKVACFGYLPVDFWKTWSPDKAEMTSLSETILCHHRAQSIFNRPEL